MAETTDQGVLSSVFHSLLGIIVFILLTVSLAVVFGFVGGVLLDFLVAGFETGVELFNL